MSQDRDEVLQAILGEKLVKLVAMGFSVVDTLDLERYQGEKSEEVERARRIARAALDASESRGLLVDILRGSDGQLRIVVCDPHGDEEAMAHRVAAAIGAITAAPGRMVGEPPRRVGEQEST